MPCRWRVLEVSLEADAGVGDRDRSFLRSLEDRRGVDLLRQDGARGLVLLLLYVDLEHNHE